MPAKATIPLQDPKIKEKLAEMKLEGETWDEFLHRVVLGETKREGATGTITLASGESLTFTTTTGVKAPQQTTTTSTSDV